MNTTGSSLKHKGEYVEHGVGAGNGKAPLPPRAEI